MFNVTTQERPFTEFRRTDEEELICNLSHGDLSLPIALLTRDGIVDPEEDPPRVVLEAGFDVYANDDSISIEVYMPSQRPNPPLLLQFSSAFDQESALVILPDAFLAAAAFVCRNFPEKKTLALELLATIYAHSTILGALYDWHLSDYPATYVLDLYESQRKII